MPRTALGEQHAIPEHLVPDDERMQPAELRVVRERLGLTHEHLARLLKVHERTVRKWEQGSALIPDGARVDVEALEQATADVISATVERLLEALHEVVLRTFRSDEDHANAHPGTQWSAGWHRAAVGAVAQEVPGLVIVWHDAPAGSVAVDMVQPVAPAASGADGSSGGSPVDLSAPSQLSTGAAPARQVGSLAKASRRPG